MVIVLLLAKLVFFIGYVPSASMEPAIQSDSYIIGYRLFDELHSGDVVIFEHDGKMLVKRIAAVGGDTVFIDDETHAVGINEPSGRYTRDFVVPVGSFFVLGDNVAGSVDGRYWSEPCISQTDIRAKAWIR